MFDWAVLHMQNSEESHADKMIRKVNELVKCINNKSIIKRD